MKLKFAALITVAVISATVLGACGNKKSDSTNSAESGLSGDGPVISLSNTEGKPGETVDVTVSLNGANNKWAMCGIHFSYDNTLVCVTGDDPKFPTYTQGDATKNMTAFTAALWYDNLSDELEKNNEFSLFFAAVSSENTGSDGDIATFQFIIPEDAEVGKIYNLDFFEYDGDMFTDVASDTAIQEYAFGNWQNGSITVI